MKNSYQHRIAELINNNFSNEEIGRLMKREYNMYFTSTQIEEKRTNEFVDKYFNDEKKHINLISEQIIEVLSNKKILTAKEISKELNNNYDTIVAKDEVNRIIYHNISEKIIRDDINYTYYLKNEINNNVKINDSEVTNKLIDFLNTEIKGCTSSAIFELFSSKNKIEFCLI